MHLVKGKLKLSSEDDCLHKSTGFLYFFFQINFLRIMLMSDLFHPVESQCCILQVAGLFYELQNGPAA